MQMFIDKEFIWNPSNCECRCGKSCDIGENVDYKNCKCRNKIVDKLLEECSENIDGKEMLYNETLNTISLNTIPLNASPLNAILLNVLRKTCSFCAIYISSNKQHNYLYFF